MHELVHMFVLTTCAVICATGCGAPRGERAPHRAALADTLTCEVSLDTGVAAGRDVGSACAYQGISYAAAPVGSSRWRPPTPAPSWSGVFDATHFGNECPQLRGGVPVGDEDCLNVNVYAPAVGDDAAPLPVLVFLHGGGNRASSNRAEAGTSLEGTYLATRGRMIVVTVNYRLGALGWLAHPALDAESCSGTSGNYGLRDQVAALGWVQRNIAAFGGDPARVTITGHSAGAVDTATLLATPAARGLFSRVIIDASGGNFEQASLADSEVRVGGPLVDRALAAGAALVPPPAACLAPVDVVACLRSLPAATLARISTDPTMVFTSGSYEPVVDGDVLPMTTLAAAQCGAVSPVPVIVGGALEEMSNPNFIPIAPAPTAAQYEAAVTAFFGAPLGARVLDRYPAAAYPTPRDAYVAASEDYRFLCPQRRLLRALAVSGDAPAYRFIFTHALSNPPPATRLGAWHGEELLFLFHTFSSPVSGLVVPSDGELALSDGMIDYWGRFASEGDPNGGGSPAWSPFSTDGEELLRLDETTVADAALHREVCEDFWDPIRDESADP